MGLRLRGGLPVLEKLTPQLAISSCTCFPACFTCLLLVGGEALPMLLLRPLQGMKWHSNGASRAQFFLAHNCPSTVPPGCLSNFPYPLTPGGSGEGAHTNTLPQADSHMAAPALWDDEVWEIIRHLQWPCSSSYHLYCWMPSGSVEDFDIPSGSSLPHSS